MHLTKVVVLKRVALHTGPHIAICTHTHTHTHTHTCIGYAPDQSGPAEAGSTAYRAPFLLYFPAHTRGTSVSVTELVLLAIMRAFDFAADVTHPLFVLVLQLLARFYHSILSLLPQGKKTVTIVGV